MAAKTLALYDAGYSVVSDYFGNIVDLCSSLTERHSILGNKWGLGTGYQTLSDTDSYYLLSFKTPVSGRCFLTFPNVEKSGNELLISSIKNGTVSGGTSFTPTCFNDDITDCPLLSVTKGGTIVDTNSNEGWFKLCGGSSNPASAIGGNSQGEGLRVLSRNSLYTYKFKSISGSITMCADLAVTYISNFDE